MAPTPEVRALLLQNNLSSVEQLRSFDRERWAKVLARWGPEAYEAVCKVSRIGWVDVKYDVQLATAIAEELGTPALREWARSSISKAMASPILKPLVDGAVHIFGAEPAALYRWICRAWGVLFRNCGDLELRAIAARSCIVVLHEPPAVVKERAYLEGMTSSFGGPLEMFDVAGKVELDVRPQEVRFLISWSAAGKASAAR